MFKYGLIQMKNSIPVCVWLPGACLDCMLPEVEVTARLEFFCIPLCLSVQFMKIVAPCSQQAYSLVPIARWLSEITVTERTKSPNFARGFFSTYLTVLA